MLGTTIKQISDDEVRDFINQQEQNFALTARGSGFEANQAKKTIAKLSTLTEAEKLALGRMNLEKLYGILPS